MKNVSLLLLSLALACFFCQILQFQLEISQYHQYDVLQQYAECVAYYSGNNINIADSVTV